MGGFTKISFLSSLKNKDRRTPSNFPPNGHYPRSFQSLENQVKKKSPLKVFLTTFDLFEASPLDYYHL